MIYINTINTDCLLLIFDHFSLNEQINLRSICKNWKQVIEKSFKLKNRLLLFPHQKSINEFKCCSQFDNHQNEKINNFIIGQNCQIIKVLFPFVIHLTVWFDYKNNYADLPDYLNQKLKIKTFESLSLCGYFKPNAQLCTKILKSINQLVKLKQLDLKAKNLFTSENYHLLPIRLNPQIIACLETFSYADYFGDLKICAINFKKLKNLSLEHENVVAQLPEMINANRNLTKTVTHLYLKPKISEMLVGKFTNLKVCKTF